VLGGTSGGRSRRCGKGRFSSGVLAFLSAFTLTIRQCLLQFLHAFVRYMCAVKG
jgi:hypothetical protein